MNLKHNTDLIAEAMRGDVPPWRKPTILHPNAGFPTNAYTNRQYGGINPMLLNLASMRRGFQSKYWATYKQWQALGTKVKNRPDDVPEGEWGTKIVRVEWNEKSESRVPTTVFVFNADQVYGSFHLKPATAYQVLKEGVTEPDYAPVDAFIAKTGADIKDGNFKKPLYYRPPKDYIRMPWRKKFTTAQWYGSVFHELIHWAEWRTGWSGSEAQGELIADIGQGYLETLFRVPHCNDMTNHHLWLNQWLESMDGDPHYIYEATTQAEKSVDFLLGRKEGRE